LLAVLAVLVVVYIAMRMGAGSTAGPQGPAPASGRAAPGRQGPTVLDPAELDVRLEALEASRPAPGEIDRNPFRFQPKAPPPQARGQGLPQVVQSGPAIAPGPPQPPPIDLKFMGFVDHPTLGKVAAFSDCKGLTAEGQEGKVVDGRYRVVKIGVESVVIERVDGSGRRTLPLSGCPPR
jgi:hypothetical protein